MAIRSRATLKTFFETGDFPTQEQFADLIDSLRHVSDALGMPDVAGLSAVLNDFATVAQVNALIAALPGVTLPITGQSDSGFSQTFTGAGLLREIVLTAQAPVEIVIRRNNDPETDFELYLPEFFPVVFVASMPLFNGAKIELLNFNGILIDYKLYLA